LTLPALDSLLGEIRNKDISNTGRVIKNSERMAIIELTAPRGRYQALKRSFSPREWRKINAMMVSIVALHVLGFFILIAFVVPGHYKNFGIGLGRSPTR